MEKSIEQIWKEGFLKDDALVAPKINDLYNQKSKHISDKIKRMLQTNLIVVAVFSIVVLLVTILVEIPVAGIVWFLILMCFVIVNKKLLNGLKKIDNTKNSYEYLLSFYHQLKHLFSMNKKLARGYYPLLFLSLVIVFWFVDAEGIPLGERLVGEVLHGFPDTFMVFGVPLIGILIIVLITGLLVIFGGKIYDLDAKIVYGRMFKKIEELIADLEELRS